MAREAFHIEEGERSVYDPGPSRNPIFRPTSAPRSFGHLRPKNYPATHQENAKRDGEGQGVEKTRGRPTSAPVVREGSKHVQGRPSGRVSAPSHRFADYHQGQGAGTMNSYQQETDNPELQRQIERESVQVIDRLNAGRREYNRPSSAPHRHMDVLGPDPTLIRPMSAGIKRAKIPKSRDKMLPASGALRFVHTPLKPLPPMRIFDPAAAPQSLETRFRPTWAISSHRSSHNDSLLSERSFSARSDASSRSRPVSASGRRGTGSGPGTLMSAYQPDHPDIPTGVITNPLATKVGRTELQEVNGSFEPLKSQSRIPDYDGLYDPHLKGFWGRKNVGKVMSLTGHTKNEWAPDSGIFETAVSSELKILQQSKDIREVLRHPPAPGSRLTSANLMSGIPSEDVISIEVSEEAISVATEHLPLSLAQPIISAWLHWGALPGQNKVADLDISAVAFDNKARAIETVFYRNLVGKHEAVVHLGDDTDIAEYEDTSEGLDMASGSRRKEGIVVNLPRIPNDVHAIMFAVTCYSDEGGLSEAAGAEMRICVGQSDSNALQNDIIRYYLSSERYNAAAPCMLIRDSNSSSGWSIRTTPRVTVANVVVEMMPVLQAMLRQSGACYPYLIQIEYCTARRPTSSLRGRRSDYTNSFKAVAMAVRRIFPFVIVQGNPMLPYENPRIGSFEITFVDAGNGSQVIWSKMETGRWPKRMDTILKRISAAMEAVQVFYELPEDRSEVQVSVLDAVSREELPYAVVEVHALGLAAQKLQISNSGDEKANQTKKKSKRKKDQAGGLLGQRLYRVQTDVHGKLYMRLPSGRYEIWGLSDGYDCEYPLEITVRPFSKHKLNARLALAREQNSNSNA